MSKRFTETTKWDDAWFVELPANFKLAWQYVCDCCDNAGLLDLSEKLANFRMGVDVDWQAFVIATDGRIERLPCGKLWVVGFVQFQCGNLSEECKAHVPVINQLKRYNLLQRVSKGYPKGIQRDKDKEKEKDKETDLQGGSKGEWLIPAKLDTQEVRDSLAAFASMRRKIGKPIKDFENSSRVLKRFESVEHLLAALDEVIGNEYQGLKTEYGRSHSGSSAPKTFAQMRLEGSRKAAEAFNNADY